MHSERLPLLLQRGEAYADDRHGRSGVAIRIRDIDFAEYLLNPWR